MSKLMILMGYSDSGKDTAFRGLPESFVNVKWSAPMKGMIENVYGLPQGALEDKTFRQQEVPTLPGVTWSDLMIRCFEYFPQIDPQMMIQAVRRQVDILVSMGADVCITDTRNHAENKAIYELSKGFDSVKVVLIIRQGFLPKASDVHVIDIFHQLSSRFPSCYLSNDGGQQRLINQTRGLYANNNI